MSEKPMELEAFRLLAETHGSKIERWPEPAREGARAVLSAGGPAFGVILREASEIDELLGAYRVAPPAASLYGRIIAAAPAARPRRQAGRMWWQGLGFATIGLAGALAGAAIVATVPRFMQMPDIGWDYDQPTAFGDLGIGQES